VIRSHGERILTNVDWSWLSFAIGLASGIGLALVSGFFGEAGKDLYVWTRRQIWPPPPGPQRVSRNFDAEEYVPDSCVWAREHDVDEKLDAGFTYYLLEGVPVYRNSSSFDSTMTREFYMVKPDAWKVDGTH